MSSVYSAMLLLAINIGFLWLLMAAPIGVRTLRIRRFYRQAPAFVWEAVDPGGANADWHHGVISSRLVPERPGIVEQTYHHLDRKGRPVRRLLAVQPTETIAGIDGMHGYTARIIDDSTLDSRFWRHFHERRQLMPTPDGTSLTVEQTDSYRGLAFLIFRYFALRREMRALDGWMATGTSRPNGYFEHPLVQTLLAATSTLLLWPFFGLDSAGLMISTFLTMVIVLHELGHMAAYRTFGHERVRMIFIPLLGGIAIGGRPYNSLFEVATCALMGPGMSAFFVPILVGAAEASNSDWLPEQWRGPILVFLLILGAFNLLNLLPMYRFDGGQVLRQIFVGRFSLIGGSFGITLVILGIGWSIGLSATTLLAALAVFTLLSLIGFASVKPKEELERMSAAERMLVSFGLYAAVAMHGYAVYYAAEILF